MSHILNGKALSDILAEELKKQVALLPMKLKLVIIQVGNLEASDRYIRHKKIFAEKIGVLVEHAAHPEDIGEKELITDVKKYNADTTVHGIIVQLPLPAHIDTDTVIEAIDPKKDVDGLTSRNIKLLFDGRKGSVPATTRGIVALLEHYKVDLSGKKVVVVGRSSLVGKPTALALLSKDATVTICHLHTKNLHEETKRADILVVAAGSRGLIGANHVSKNQIVVDVGINIFPGSKKLEGDVDFPVVEKIVKAITPVPGGVGPMTIVSLFQNLIEACIINQ